MPSCSKICCPSPLVIYQAFHGWLASRFGLKYLQGLSLYRTFNERPDHYRRLKTLHVWQVFAEAYPEEFRGPRNRYRLVIGGPALPLLEYFNGMMSAALSWMTLLSISTSIAQKQDLIHLAKLRNLVALDLAVDSPKSPTVPSSLDTRIIRTWSELADSEDAFKHLHVLMIRGQTDVSPMLFEYLSKLPSLRLLIMQSYPDSQRKTKQLWARVALTCGWAVEQASHQSLTAFKVQDEQDDFEPERTQHKNAFKDDYDLKSRLSGQPLDLLRRFCYGSPSSVSQGTAIDGEAITSLPFIECRIGKPVGFETASSLVANDVLIFRRTETGLKSLGRSLQTTSVKADGKRKSTLVHHLAHLPKRPAMKPSARTVEGLLSDFRAV